MANDIRDSKKYQKKELKQHILDLPDTYIGETDPSETTVWIANEDFTLTEKKISWSEGLYKINDEPYTNASDHALRTLMEREKSSKVKITKNIKITVTETSITVWNDGDGIPVVEHTEHKVLIPTMIFGQLLTSGNYDKEEKRIVGGKNGYGAKVTSIFSTSFSVETVDHYRKKKYSQTWINNMSEPKKKAKVINSAATPYTKITFTPDFKRFKMKKFSKDMIALLRKRAIDIAGTTPKHVNVYFNGVKIKTKKFEDYVGLYIGSKKETKRIFYEQDRWQVAVCASPGGVMKQTSFVNGVCTINGGKHVEYIANQISRKLAAKVNGKKKTGLIQAKHIKQNLWIFLNCSIENPGFDSQTKKTLTTPVSKFGSKCNLPDSFIDKLKRTDIVKRSKLLKNFHEKAGIKKSDGKKCRRVRGLAKLDDANWAGTSKSHLCTLILTEGDSAKTFAVAGLSILGRDKYGVFPLKGKLLNTRNANELKNAKNTEIQSIKKIIGLQEGKEYTSVKNLRYGKVLILTDQDRDGIHIKGLVMNLFGDKWPSLLKLGFLASMYTPYVKVFKGNKIIASFACEEDLETWKLLHWKKGLFIKFYKGLGTSSDKEAIECFKFFKLIQYIWGENSNEALDMAFNDKRSNDRKRWLRHYVPESNLDLKKMKILFEEFVHQRLIQFSQYSNIRAIPSFWDGFKPSQRKIMFYVLKHNVTRDIKVAQLGSTLATATQYHHAEKSVHETIVKMAQNYVGSNNLELLLPEGNFGTRTLGGEDCSSPRYIYTKISPLARLIFKAEDDPLLEYCVSEGKTIEPRHYLPVIPMILVNGACGIGTGYSSNVPNHDPLKIIHALRCKLQNKTVPKLIPWYRHFKGTIEKKNGKFITKGVYRVTGKYVWITELPIGRWTDKYTDYLESHVYTKSTEDKKKKVEPFIVDWEKGKVDEKDPHGVNIKITFKQNELDDLVADPKKFIKKLRLEESKSCVVTNLYMFDPTDTISKFKMVDAYLRCFYACRLPWYQRRKDYILAYRKMEIEMLNEQIRFIKGMINDSVKITRKKNPAVLEELKVKHKFKPNPMKGSVELPPFPNEVYEKALEGELVEEEEDELELELSCSSAEPSISLDLDDLDGEEEKKDPRDVKTILEEDYSYLIGMKIGTLTDEKRDQLIAKRDKKQSEIDQLEKLTPSQIWLQDLDTLEKAIRKRYKK